jgi:glucose/mannose-6-phosphate isomerase
VAAAAGLALAVFPDQGSPRSLLGWSLGIVAGILEKAGVLELEDAEIDSAVAAGAASVGRCEPGVPTADNPAKRLAWSLLDRFVIVSGSGFLAPVARRWKVQLNENSKVTAAWEELPEATHNTVVGFEQPETLRDHLGVVLLASELDHPRNRLRATLMGDLLQAGQIWHTSVETTGVGRLGHALDAVVLGDHVSVYLAFMYGVDPTPIDVIDHIKQQLVLADQPESR